MVGRIECYLHSDSVTPNKGGAIVKVETETDFAARTKELIAFTRLVASRAYASGADVWRDITNMFPSMEEDRRQLEAVFKEKIVITDIAVMKLDS